jgi:hypothetical protein
MKKYLMSLAAIALVGSAFVSCSNDDMANPSQADVDQAKYEAAFLAYVGGKIAPNQDWGFSTTRGNLTRSMNISFDYYHFPSDASADKFLSDVPGGVNSYAQECAANNQTDGYGSGTSYIDASWEGQVNIWGVWDGSQSSGGTLYIKGNCDFSNRKFYVAQNTEVYLVEGAVLTLNATNASDLQGGCNFYLAPNSKIVTPAELVLNNGLHIYNHGTIEAYKLHGNGPSWLVNAGTVKVTTTISVENDLSVIENNGTITAADLYTAGSGKFENNGSVTITGSTFVHSNNNTWVNNGQYHTGNFMYYAASDEVINKCKLTVDEKFGINLGDNPGNGNFKMDGGSSVVTKYFYGGGNWTGTYAGTSCNAQGGPFYIYMGAGSVFKVTETATMHASKANYGIYGVGDDFAVFQAKNIVMGDANQNQGFEVTYGGNLAVVAENHFANGNDGEVTHPYVDIKGNAKVYAPGYNDGKPAITIAETPCNPGFKGGDEELYDLRIIAEDLSASQASDFDFNDIVIDVKYGSPAKLRLMAAGGTLPLRIKVGDADNLDYEVHKLFGEWPASYQLGMGDKTEQNPKPTLLPIINTGVGPEKDPVIISGISLNIQNAAQANELLKIEVYKNGSWQEMTATKGKAACKLAVKPTFIWQKEYTSIKESYPLFLEWCANDPEVVWY